MTSYHTLLTTLPECLTFLLYNTNYPAGFELYLKIVEINWPITFLTVIDEIFPKKDDKVQIHNIIHLLSSTIFHKCNL